MYMTIHYLTISRENTYNPGEHTVDSSFLKESPFSAARGRNVQAMKVKSEVFIALKVFNFAPCLP